MRDVHLTRRGGGMSDPAERARLMGAGLCAKADFYETGRRNMTEALDRERERRKADSREGE